MDSTMPTVVPYVTFGEDLRPIEVLAEIDDDTLAQIAESYISRRCKENISHRPIRTGDLIQIVTEADVQMKQEVRLQEFRDEDRMVSSPPKPSAPPTMQQVLHQAPPRAHSREIQLPWEIERPTLAEDDVVLVTLALEEAIQDPSQRKAYLTRHRSDS
jgi:hypothetical protein